MGSWRGRVLEGVLKCSVGHDWVVLGKSHDEETSKTLRRSQSASPACGVAQHEHVDVEKAHRPSCGCTGTARVSPYSHGGTRRGQASEAAKRIGAQTLRSLLLLVGKQPLP